MKVEMCSLDGDKKKCYTARLSKGVIPTLLGLMAAAAVINFFVGMAISVPLGIDYLGYSLVLSLLCIACGMVPIGGIVILTVYFNDAVLSMQALMGIVSNGWIDVITSITWFLGLAIQIVVMVLFVLWLIKRLQKRK